MRQRAWLPFALVLGLSGCTHEEMVPVAYEVPIAGNSQGANAAYHCVAACRRANRDSANGFFGCLGTCPDVRIVQGAECGPPNASSYCYTALVPEEVPDPQASEDVALFFGEVLGHVLASAIGDGGSHHHHHESHHRHRH